MYLCGQFMDYKMIHIEETDSTNRWMKEMKQGDGSFVTSLWRSIRRRGRVVAATHGKVSGERT